MINYHKEWRRHFSEHQIKILTLIITEIIMATLDDKIEAIGADVKTLLASGVKVDLTPVLAAVTGVQNTANAILAQDFPTPPLAPVLTGISPNSGSVNGGETITVTGSNFTGATGVLFGLVAGTDLVVTNDTTITVTSPAQPAATVDVQVVDAAGTSAIVAADQFTLS